LIGTRRVQWPPANHQPLVSSIDLDLNMQEPMDDQQPDDSHLNEIVEPNSDPSNQLTDDSEEPVIEDTQIDSPDSNELNSDGKVIFIGFEISATCIHNNQCMPILIWFFGSCQLNRVGIQFCFRNNSKGSGYKYSIREGNFAKQHICTK